MGTGDVEKELEDIKLRLRAKKEELKYKYREVDAVECDIRELQSLYHDVYRRIYIEQDKKSA